MINLRISVDTHNWAPWRRQPHTAFLGVTKTLTFRSNQIFHFNLQYIQNKNHSHLLHHTLTLGRWLGVCLSSQVTRFLPLSHHTTGLMKFALCRGVRYSTHGIIYDAWSNGRFCKVTERISTLSLARKHICMHWTGAQGYNSEPNPDWLGQNVTYFQSDIYVFGTSNIKLTLYGLYSEQTDTSYYCH